MYACDYLENGVLNVLRGVTFAAPRKSTSPSTSTTPARTGRAVRR